MARFDNISIQPTTSSILGNGRFDSVQPTTGRFDNIGNISQDNQGGFFSRSFSALGGAFGAIGRVLGASQQFTTGAFEYGLEKTGILPKTGINPIQAVKKQETYTTTFKRVGETIPRQVSGIVNPFALALGNYEPSQSWAGNLVRELPVTIFGTLADIFADPLWLASSLGVVAKGTTAVGETIAKGVRTMAEEIPAVQKVGDMLGKAFITRYAQRPEFQALDIGRKIQESLLKEDVGKLVSPIIEKPQYIQQRIAQVIQGGITTNDEIKTLAEPIRQELDRVGESISKLNPKLLSEETFTANKGTYFPRLYTNYEFPTEQETLNQFFSQRAVSVPRERFIARTLTPEEALAKPELIKEAGYPAVKALTQLNIVEARQKFFSEVSKLASNEPKPGWIQMSEDKALGDLAGKFLPAAEQNAIASIRRIPTATEELYSKALTTWKTFKTAYNPATISRNDLTNFFILNPLGGVGPHRLDIYARTANEIMTKGPMYQLARKEGLEISTQQAAELTQKASRFYNENQGLVKQFFSKIGDFNMTVKNFYGSQDKFFKLANFIKGVTEDGLTPTQALHRANFYLVDYSEVPQAIEWLRKSPIGIPFISFTYGVTKPLAKTLLERPDRLAAFYKILNGIQQMNPEGETPQDLQKEKDVLPSWISTGTYLRLPIRDEFKRGQYINLQYILPFNIVESNSLIPSNPLLSIYSAIFQNKDSFTGRDITKPTDTPQEKIQKEVTQVLSQLLPSSTPFVGFSYKKITDMIKNRPDANGFVRNKLQTFLDVLGGIKITPIDPTIEAQKRAAEKQKELTDLKSELFRVSLDKTIFPIEKAKQRSTIIDKIKKVFSP